MKQKTIKCTNGESTIYVCLYGVNASGRITEDESATCGWTVVYGGAHGQKTFVDRYAARASFDQRIGHLVADGYYAKVDD